MSEAATTVLGTADIREILKLLPIGIHSYWSTRHRDHGDNSADRHQERHGQRSPHFTGHFPEQPIMPGVLLIEGMAQTAGAICARKTGDGNNLVYFMTIDNARFRKPVVPGDRVEFHVVKQKQRGISGNFTVMQKLTGNLSRKLISAP